MDEAKPARLNVAQLEKGLFGDDDAHSDGLEVGDPRLDAISDAAYKSQYEQAAGLAQAAWSDGVRDIRLVGYQLYGYYLERDVVGLGWSFDQLTSALTTQWPRLGPANKLKCADGSLHWLFQTLVRQLTGHEQLKDERYQRWSTDAGIDAMAAAATAAGPLSAAVEALFPNGKALDKLGNLAGWLRAQEAALRAAAQTARAAAERQAADEHVAAVATAPGSDDAEPRPPTTNGAVMVEGAPPFALLIRKIKLFEQLIGAGDLQKAAVVARDVDQLVQSFDPVLFLPKVFVPFFRLMSKNIESLEPAMMQLEAPTFKSLVQLYHADLEAFADY